MLTQSTVDKLIPILRREVRRALKMSLPGFPKPYYCSFLLRDAHWFNTSANSGSICRNLTDRNREAFCDLRVGSYQYDQVMDGGIRDSDDELDSTSHCTLPIDDQDYDGLRINIWKLLESKFREALHDFNLKESSRISSPDPNGGFKSFTKAKRVLHKDRSRFKEVERERWVRFCKRASIWLSQLPKITGSSVEIDASQETKVFVNTEGSAIVQNHQVFSLNAHMHLLTSEGSQLEQDLVINCAKESELPSFAKFKELALEKYEKLMRLAKAKKIHAFSGPVLLYPNAAGVLFHEVIGHRLEGSRLLASVEAQTFKDQEGKQIFNLPITVRDNPNIDQFSGQKCIGSYKYDDEGVAAQDAILVEDGVLKDFLTTRAAIKKGRYSSNGHARTKQYQRPISRMAVTVVESEDGQPIDRLRARLLQEIKRQKKPFGMIVYDTNGGETETTKYDFQTFAGEISYCTLLYQNGKEVCVRGVNFVGTPLQALSNIVAIGDKQEIDNGFCGAESGTLPITTISPAVLLSNLELQGKNEEIYSPSILQRPKMLRRKPKKRSKRKG